MKKIVKLFSLVLGFCLICASFFGCGTTTTASADGLSYVSMRINPEIELVVDKDGEVVAVNAMNEDGETVLCQLTLVGMTVEEAGEAFTAMATELGFIDVTAENATVYILAEGSDEEFVEELEEKITKKIHDYFDKKGICGKVSPEELEEFKALAEEWQVDLKEAKLISRILELYPEMTVEEILVLGFEAKLQLIKDDCVKNGLPADMREEYKEKVEEIKAEFEEFFELMKELKELEGKLNDETLTEDERATLQAEYDAKKAELDELKKQYEEAIEALKLEERKKAEDVREEHKRKAEERRNENADKLKAYEEKFEEAKEEIEAKIKEWRENRK